MLLRAVPVHAVGKLHRELRFCIGRQQITDMIIGKFYMIVVPSCDKVFLSIPVNIRPCRPTMTTPRMNKSAGICKRLFNTYD
jgi:hypothetical protein